MKSALKLCLEHPFLVLILSASIFIGSLQVMKSLPVDVFPELKVPRVTVQTEAPGLTAEEVEQQITIPLEAAVNGIPGVRTLRSSAGAGLSFVWIDFGWNTDIYRARQMVSERLSGLKAEMTPIVSVTGEIMLVALTGDETVSPSELRRVAEYELRPRLTAVSGIGNVVVIGGELPEYQVNILSGAAALHGITAEEIVRAATAAQNTDTAGYLPHVRGQELPVRQLARITSVEDLKQAYVKDRIRLADVAEVVIGGAPRRGSAAYNGQSCALLSIQKAPGGNTIRLTEAVDGVLKSFKAANLPAGMKVYGDAYRQADFINLSMDNGRLIIRDAALIVVAVLFLVLVNVRAVLVTLITLPLSLAFSVLVFPIFGLGINIMTLGGLAVAVGDVVDNAIIFVEIAWRRLRENPDKPRREILTAAGIEIFNSAGFSTAIILLVFTPLLVMTGLEGQFFRPLGIAYCIAMAVSLVLALTVVPALVLLFYKHPKPRTFAPAVTRFLPTSERLQAFYLPLLRLCLRFPKTVCALAAAVTVASLALASTFGTSFLPPFHEDCYTVFVSTVPGTSLQETERVSEGVMKRLSEIKGVKSIARRTGRAERDEHAEPVSASEFLVRVDLATDQKKLRAEIDQVVGSVPGSAGMLGYPIAHRISSVLSGTPAEIAVNIFGDDLPQLRGAAKKAAAVLRAVPGIADVRANREILVDSICIRYRRGDLLRFGLTQDEAAAAVSGLLQGRRVGQVVKNLSRWDIVVRLNEAERNSPEALKELLLLLPDGRRIHLSEIADIYREETANLIVRDGTRRKALISCNAAPEANIGDVVAAMKRTLDPEMNELGCTVTYGGTYEARVSSGHQLKILGSAIFVIMLLLMTCSLGSVRRAAIAAVNLPLSIIGGVIAVKLFSPTAVPVLSVASLEKAQWLLLMREKQNQLQILPLVKI